MKLLDARRDYYRRLAREQGYRSRSAFKLKELNKSYRLIGPGFSVLDLGCAPGGWLQVASQLAGNRGMVMGVDKEYVEEIPNVTIIRYDISDVENIVDDALEYFGKRINTVICDMSPNVTGRWSVDHAVQIASNYDCVQVMDKVLASKGNALFKVFDGEYTLEFRDFVKKKFSKVLLTKPKASRKASSELYFVCLGYLL